MGLRFYPFGREHYAAYASWFTDPELHRRLGPLDEAWLTATLEDTCYETWAVFCEDVFTGVLEVDVDPVKKLAVIVGVAIKLDLRRQGIALASLNWLLEQHRQRGIYSHRADVALDNLAAQHCFARLGFTLVGEKPTEQGFLRFVRRLVPAAPR